jgi:hypothetical protein
MLTSQTNNGHRPVRARWLPLLAVIAPLAAGADVIALFDEVTDRTVTPVGVSFPAVTPEEIRTIFANDFAAVHVAMYDAVVAISGGYDYFSSVPTTPAAGASTDAAAASAACDVLRGLFPNRAPQYETACQAYLAALPDSDAKTRGIAIGAEVAAGTLASRANDGRMTAVTYVPGSEPGDFRGVNPAMPFLPFVRPFVMTSASQFRADGPPALTSHTYATDLNEVKAYGSAASTVRSAAQTDLARFNTEPPPRFWPRNLRRFVSDGRSTVENARLMAMIWVAQADAVLGCFESKYYFEFWRPTSAITLADTDGNPATIADAGWTPVVPTPNHPEYPAAHSCTAASVGTVLDAFFGTSKIDFSMDSTVAGLANPVRQYHSTGDFVKDLKLARIYGGMHYRTSTDHGAVLGKRVGKLVVKDYFREKKTLRNN